MNDLNTLLDRAAGPATVRVDARADLTRGHRALARTRRRRAAAGLVGVAAAGVVGFGAVRLADAGQRSRRARRSRRTAPSGRHQPPGPAVRGRPLHLRRDPGGLGGPGRRPAGGDDRAGRLTRPGAAVVRGQAGHPLRRQPAAGEQVDVDGRTFWVRESDSGYTTIATRTQPGEPEGNVRIQYPSTPAGPATTMLAFLAGVHVGPGAQQGVG